MNFIEKSFCIYCKRELDQLEQDYHIECYGEFKNFNSPNSNKYYRGIFLNNEESLFLWDLEKAISRKISCLIYDTDAYDSLYTRALFYKNPIAVIIDKGNIIAIEINIKNLPRTIYSDPDLSEMPNSISKLEKLKYLMLGGVSVTNVDWVIQTVPELEYLSLIDLKTENSDFIELPNLLKLTKLQFLIIEEFFIKDLFNHIVKLPELIELSLEKTNVREIPLEIKKLVKLRSLIISQSKLHAVPNNIDCLYNLEYLDVSYNEISILPDSLANLPKLHSLWIRDNQFKSLPLVIFKMQNLKFLSINQKDKFSFTNPNIIPGRQMFIEINENQIKSFNLKVKQKLKTKLFPSAIENKLTEHNRLDFYFAQWCLNCRKATSNFIIKLMQKNPNFQVNLFDVDTPVNSSGIKFIPTIKFFKDGRQIKILEEYHEPLFQKIIKELYDLEID